jgi:AcrR family transcriptional regulator
MRLHDRPTMGDDHRQRILHAAARVYAQHGWRGATTRRIAEEAGVNEVTLFRQFGSKDALLDLMMHECSRIEQDATFPQEPVDPEQEILAWVTVHHSGLVGMRSIVRQMMSDAEERPDAANCASQGPSAAMAQLREYVVKLRRHGWITESGDVTPIDVRAAVTMLMGAVFADGMNRDMMPAMFTQPVPETLRAYVRIFLRGVGALQEPAHRASRTVDRDSNSTTVPE